MQGIFVFDLSVNTRKCGISHNKTSARNRSRALRIRFPKSRSNSGGNRPATRIGLYGSLLVLFFEVIFRLKSC